jgi:ppGpp synthetase/RelA/SpoT-type nucleotidyltranferase
MITPSQTRQKYASIEQHLDFARRRVRDTLQVYCEPKGYALVSRIKTLSSVSEKIESGRFTKWSDLDDLIACAVVVPTLAQEKDVLAFLEEAFVAVSINHRGSSKKPPDVFRFDTTRFIGKLRVPGDISPDDPLYQIQFEVQIRSAFEHAWSVTTHALTYKGEHVEWPRFRLAAQLKSAVEQLDILILAFEETSSKVSQSSWPETEAKAELSVYFKKQFASGALPIELTPQDWTRFSENIYQMVRSSQWGRRNRPLDIVAKVKTVMEAALDQFGHDHIPRSISLVQFVFATLFTAGTVLEPLEGYCPIITSELETIYPDLTNFQNRFDFHH